MAKITDGQRSARQYSNTILWISLIFGLLFSAILLESLCLGILYVYDSLKGKDNNLFFAKEHILTSPFASTPTGPVPGKHFLGHLRSVHPRGWAQFLVPDGLLGWHLASDISTYYAYSQLTNEDLIVTDDNGFSVDVDDPPAALQKSVDAYRVIVLGGSTVMGEGAQRPSQNIIGMLRRGVRERALTGPNGRRVEFINAGVDAYNSAQEYLYFVSDLLRFKPDLVIVYDGWNDADISRFKVSPFRTERQRDLTRRVNKSYSIAGSVLFAAQNLKYSLTDGDLKLGMVELPWRVFRKLSSTADAVQSTSAPFDPRSIEYYRNNHRAFLAVADDQLSVALFLQPVVGTDDRMLSADEKASWWYPGLDKKLRNRIPFYEGARHILADLKERAHGNGHVCIADLSHSLKGVSETVYADSGHLLPKGNEIVAAHILDELVSCGLLR
jgi:hypothetical protein